MDDGGKAHVAGAVGVSAADGGLVAVTGVARRELDGVAAGKVPWQGGSSFLKFFGAKLDSARMALAAVYAEYPYVVTSCIMSTCFIALIFIKDAVSGAGTRAGAEGDAKKAQ